MSTIQKKGVVKSIQMNAFQAREFMMHSILFTDGYLALEKDNNGTRFIEGETAVFNITSPGKAGKPDWIEKASVKAPSPITTTTTTGPVEQIAQETQKVFGASNLFTPKDFLIVAQSSLSNSVQFTSGMPVDIKTVLSNARELAEGTFATAIHLYNKNQQTKANV